MIIVCVCECNILGVRPKFLRWNGQIWKISKNDTYTAACTLPNEDQSTGCYRSFCCRNCCEQYYRHGLTTRAWWLVAHAWGPMTHRRWRFTDDWCTPVYSSSWNALGALKLNQMSTTLHSNTQTTPTPSVVYTSNKNTQRIRLDHNSFGNTRSLVENSVTPINLRLGYNVKSDIYL